MGQVDGDNDQEVKLVGECGIRNRDRTFLCVLTLIVSLLMERAGLSIYSDFSVF